MFRGIVASLYDIRAAVNAAREYEALRHRIGDARAARSALKAFLPD